MQKAQELLENTEDCNRALKYFEEAANLNPNNQPALLGKGSLLYYQGHFLRATRTFQQLLTINPGHRTALKFQKKLLKRTEDPLFNALGFELKDSRAFPRVNTKRFLYSPSK